MFLSLIWMVLLRFAAGLMAWAAVLSVNIFCAACTLLAFLKVCLLCILSDMAMQSACTAATCINNAQAQAQLDFHQLDCDTDATNCFATLCSSQLLLSAVMIGLLYMAYPDGCRLETTFLPRLRPHPVRGHHLLCFISHQSRPWCDVHPHSCCKMNGLLMIAVWHLWDDPLLCLGKQRGCRAHSSREHRCIRQEGMADCGLHHGRLHGHPHPAHLAHAAPAKGMHSISYARPFV